jgi:hypothetical protein
MAIELWIEKDVSCHLTEGTEENLSGSHCPSQHSNWVSPRYKAEVLSLASAYSVSVCRKRGLEHGKDIKIFEYTVLKDSWKLLFLNCWYW